MRLKPDQSIYPCPFCFGELMGHTYTIDNNGGYVFIGCDNCGASGPVYRSGKTLEEVAASDQQAIDGWNNLANFRPTQKVDL